MSAQASPIHQGDTFDVVLAWSDDAGLPVDLTGATIRSTIRNEGALVQELTVTLLDQVAWPGQFRLLATAAQTALWPEATLEANVRLELAGGVVRSTESFFVAVRVPPTRAP